MAFSRRLAAVSGSLCWSAARLCSIRLVCADADAHTKSANTTRMPLFRVRATIPILTAEEVSSRAAAALSEARQRFQAIERLPLESATPESVLDRWDDAAIIIEDAFGPISLLNSVHPEAGVRDAADRALIDESVFMTELFQNEQLFERVRRIAPRTSAQKQLKKDLIESFEDSGVALAPEKRQRFREISERLTELAQEFAK